MTVQTPSQTSEKTYMLTIDKFSGLAVECSCPAHFYHPRSEGCKHIRLMNEEIRKAKKFAKLFAKYDCRANGQAVSQRCYYELSIGA